MFGTCSRNKMSIFVILLLSLSVFVSGQSLGKCPKKETMKTFDPKEVGGAIHIGKNLLITEQLTIIIAIL